MKPLLRGLQRLWGMIRIKTRRAWANNAHVLFQMSYLELGEITANFRIPDLVTQPIISTRGSEVVDLCANSIPNSCQQLPWAYSDCMVGIISSAIHNRRIAIYVCTLTKLKKNTLYIAAEKPPLGTSYKRRGMNANGFSVGSQTSYLKVILLMAILVTSVQNKMIITYQ
jgi:hypothetical protein